MADAVKSIFRQKEYEKIYKIMYIGQYWPDDYIGRENLGRCEMREAKAGTNYIQDIKIAELDIDLPLLEPNDRFFLADQQMEVQIKSRIKSSDGSIVYYIQDKLIETENTEKTKRKCEEIVEKCRYLVNRNEKLTRELEEYKKMELELKAKEEKFRSEHKFFDFLYKRQQK